MAKQGHIKIYRSIEDWRWFNTPHMLEFWVRLLLKANWRDEEKDGEMFNRGEIVVSVPELAKETGLTVKQVRVFLGRLAETGEITVDRARSRALSRTRMGTSSRTRITICNYVTYQSLGREVGQKVRQEVGTEVGHPPSSPSSSSPAPSSSTPPISPNLFEEQKEERDTGVSPKKRTIDFDQVKRTWNDSMTRKVPKIQGLSEARKEKVKVRVEEMGGWDEARAILQDCFKKVNDSDFCNGANDHQWVATFDWFFSNDKNWMKVSEGNYDNRRQASRFEQSMGVAQRAKNLIGLIYGTGNTGTTDGFADTPDEQ